MSKKNKVLYVDDEEAILRIFKNTFRTKYDIYTCSTPEEGLKVINEENIDLVLSDQRMPTLTGVEFLTKIKEIKPSLKSILITGYTDILTLEEAINKAGVWKYVTKPWSVEYLESSINEALRINQLEEEKSITEKKLKETNERLQLTLNNTGLGIWDCYISTQQTNHSDQYYKLLGLKREETKLSVHEFMKTVHPDDLQEMQVIYQKIISMSEGAFKFNCRVRHVEGHYLHLSYEGEIIESSESGEPVRMIGIVKDISDEIEKEKRELALILATEDKERKRVAIELHDGLGQNLTAANLYMEGVKQYLDNLKPEVRQNFMTAQNFLQQAITESRNIAHNLMPKAINDYGLATSISSMLKALQKASKTMFNFYNNINNKRYQNQIELGLYRIAQEAVNNILKYANASNVSLQMIEDQGEIILTIEDDGEGFDIQNLNEQNSFGIISMKNRTKALSGQFNIDSNINRGTVITVIIPFS